MVEAISNFLRLASLPIRKMNHPKASPTTTPRMPGMGMALACIDRRKKKFQAKKGKDAGGYSFGGQVAVFWYCTVLDCPA